MAHSRVLNYAVLAGLLISLGSIDGVAQKPSPCRPIDEAGTRFVQFISAIATAKDPDGVRRRREIAVPPLSAQDISQVADETVCAGLVAPYDSVTQRRDAKTGSSIPGSGQLYVVRAGPVYVATDPTITFGEWGILAVFDEKQRLLFHGLY